MRAVVLLLLLAGCTSAEVTAKRSYQAAVETYKACLQANQSPKACEREKALMDTDERRFNSLIGGAYGNSAGVNVAR